MRKIALILIVPLVLLALASIPGYVPPVHAAQHTGLICLADPTAAALAPTNPCPAAPWMFNGPNVTRTQQLSVGVYAHNSGNLTGFDITLLGNHTVLRPVGVDLSRTILPGSPTIIRECVSGVVVVGTGCNPTDNIDTIHFAVNGGFGQIVNYPVTGLLFTATYNITAVSISPSTPLGFQTGCSSTSASPLCMTIINGTTTPVPETVQVANFENITPPPYVTLSASTSVITATSGDSTTATITANGQNGWPTGQTNRVTFTSKAASGLTATLFPGFCATGGSSGSCSSTLTVSASKPGNYSLTVFGNYAAKAASGLSVGKTSTLAAPVALLVRVFNFTVSASPKSVAVLTGDQGKSNVTVTFGSNYPDTVSLSDTISPSTGLSCSLSATLLVATGNSTLTCSGTGGIYRVTVTGFGDGLSLSTNVTFSVTAFQLSATPSSVNVLVGSTGSSTITVSRATGFTGAVALTDTVSPSTGVVCSQTPPLVTNPSTTSSMSCNTTSPGIYTVKVNGTSAGVPSVAINVTLIVLAFNVTASPISSTVLVGVSGTSTITVVAGTGSTGMVTLTDSFPSGMTCTQTPGSVTLGTSPTSMLSCNSSTAGNYLVTVTGNKTGVPNSSANVTFIVQDFTIGASSPPLVALGQSAMSTIIIAAVNGFAGVVSLSDVSPSGLACNAINPTTVTGSGTATVSCTGAAATSYALPITGTIASLSHTATATFNFGDFSLSANPTSVTVNAGASGTSVITVTAANSFAGTVSLSTASSPSGLSCSVSPASVSGAGTSTLSCQGSSNSYSVNVTGTSGSLTHKVTLAYIVQDFSVAASPTSVTFVSSTTNTTTITVSAVSGFSGTVAVTASSSPGGLTVSVSPASVSGSGSVTLTFSSSSANTYTVTITASSGTLSHTASVSVTVTSPPSTPSNTSTIFGLDPTLFYAIIGVIAVAVIAGVAVALRRRGRESGESAPATSTPQKPSPSM